MKTRIRLVDLAVALGIIGFSNTIVDDLGYPPRKQHGERQIFSGKLIGE